jgi:hypothetical protein
MFFEGVPGISRLMRRQRQALMEVPGPVAAPAAKEPATAPRAKRPGTVPRRKGPGAGRTPQRRNPRPPAPRSPRK